MGDRPIPRCGVSLARPDHGAWPRQADHGQAPRAGGLPHGLRRVRVMPLNICPVLALSASAPLLPSLLAMSTSDPSRPAGGHSPLLALDHAALAIRDLGAAAAAFERLGFCLSPISMHAGAAEPGGPTVPWGSGNRCAMFRDGYFELLGLVDASLPSNVKAMVERYEGLHIVALDCDDAEAAHARLTHAGVFANRPVALERDATFGPHDESVRRAKFSNVYLDPQQHPEARFIVIEHRTREVLWQPHLLTHANGVQALAGVVLAVPHLPAAVDRLQRLLGAGQALSAQVHRFVTRRGLVDVVAQEHVPALSPVLRDAPVHRVAAVRFAVASLAALQALLSERGVRHVAAADALSGQPSVWVGPDEAAHAAIQFISLV